MANYKRNHYVPQWYQHRFFTGNEPEKKFFCLDLKPETKMIPNGKVFSKDLFRRGPEMCFSQENLYTTKFGNLESTEIEEKFFGKIDSEGKKAVEYFSDFRHPSINGKAFYALLTYMSIQKLRTQKGLNYLESLVNKADKNQLLIMMQRLIYMHCALWTECIWCIVDSSQSETKFIISDHPVVVYNKACFPGSAWCKGANDPGIWLNGTHTIFPLSASKALFLTNVSWARNPYGIPLNKRPHSELFRPAMFDFSRIQTDRMLSEEEVIAINYIIKKRAFRYIIAARKEWLYPEYKIKYNRWDKIGDSYILMPDPRSMSFSSEIILGFNNGQSDSFDEYGRKPWHHDYKDKNLNENEWNTFHAFKGEYARIFGPKKRGITFSLGKKDKIEDGKDYHAYHLSLEAKYKAKFKRKYN